MNACALNIYGFFVNLKIEGRERERERERDMKDHEVEIRRCVSAHFGDIPPFSFLFLQNSLYLGQSD